jgi:hypothetical protein
LLCGLIVKSSVLAVFLWIGGVLMRGLLGVVSFLLSLDFLESYDLDLSLLNLGKVGRPYRVTYMYVMFLAVVRYLFSMPYRQLEGFTRALHRLIPRLFMG